MAKDLKDMTRQEVHSYFKFKDYRGEQLKVVMAALDYVLFGELSAPRFFTLNAPVFRMVWINIQNS